MKNVEIENANNGIFFAERYEAEKLRKACLACVAKNMDQIFRTQNFRDLQTETLIEIFKLSNYFSPQERFEYYIGRESSESPFFRS